MIVEIYFVNLFSQMNKRLAMLRQFFDRSCKFLEFVVMRKRYFDVFLSLLNSLIRFYQNDNNVFIAIAFVEVRSLILIELVCVVFFLNYFLVVRDNYFRKFYL